MEISQKLLSFLFLASFTAGWVLGIVYDMFFLIRLFFYNSNHEIREKQGKGRGHLYLPMTFLMDFCFALFCGILLILLLYFLNDGVFRCISPLGICCGIFTYRVTLGRLVKRIFETLVRLIQRVVSLILKAVWKPIRACFDLIYGLVIAPILQMLKNGYDRQMIKRTRRLVESFIQDASQVFSGKK